MIDLAAADGAVGSALDRLAPPSDMKALIVGYEQGFRDRIREIVGAVEGASTRREYVYRVADVRTLPPIMYPSNMVSTALNYREQALEMAGLNSGPPALVAGAPAPGTATPTTVSAPGIWERTADDSRWNPYMFLKAASSVIADGEAVRLPVGRDRVDSECELGVVIGRNASRVPLAQAVDYIFGFTKSHDTFAPLGPFIVPKEFVDDPRILTVRYEINGELIDSSTPLDGRSWADPPTLRLEPTSCQPNNQGPRSDPCAMTSESFTGA